MKKALLILLFLPLISLSQSPFWTEDFGTGCNQGMSPGAYLGPNGVWTVTSTGTNVGSSNQWYISAMENGNAEGECGTGCGNDRTLHLGNTAISTLFIDIDADNGASYYEGLTGFCGLIPCGSTDKRADSPVINMSSYDGITVSFLYIEGGNSIDNATMWYFDGSTWGQIADMAKTFSGACSPQGLWTSFSIVLPASANNNPNVKIGFRWINNDNGDATDPSFAVDDIVISSAAPDTEPPVVVCGENVTVPVADLCEASLPDVTGLATVTDNLDPSPVLTQDPPVGTIISFPTEVQITAIDNSGNISFCTLTVTPVDLTPPVFVCPPDTIIEGAPGAISAYITFIPPAATDNCGSVYLVNDYTGTDNPTANYPAGETLVTYTATDAVGNFVTCSFLVTVNAEECCLADYNCDGIVNISDLLFFMGEYGTLSTAADLTFDGTVNIGDLLIFMGQFGLSCE